MDITSKINTFFGFGDSIGAIAASSAILALIILLAPVVVGLILYGLERLQIELIGLINRDLAYFWVNYATFPGTFVHEMSHLVFAVITGAEVNEIEMFETDCGRLGHISYSTRGPWFIQAVQHSLSAVAPTVVGLVLGFFLIRYTVTGSHSIWATIGLWYLIFCLIDHSTMSDSDLMHYFQGVWIFILPLFLLFFIAGLV